MSNLVFTFKDSAKWRYLYLVFFNCTVQRLWILLWCAYCVCFEVTMFMVSRIGSNALNFLVFWFEPASVKHWIWLYVQGTDASAWGDSSQQSRWLQACHSAPRLQVKKCPTQVWFDSLHRWLRAGSYLPTWKTVWRHTWPGECCSRYCMSPSII
jgi:hypothetical protein